MTKIGRPRKAFPHKQEAGNQNSLLKYAFMLFLYFFPLQPRREMSFNSVNRYKSIIFQALTSK